MRAQITLIALAAASACHKKETRKETPTPRFSLDGSSDIIPLDAVGDEPLFLLVPKDLASDEAKTLTNFEGRAKAPYAQADTSGVSLRGKAAAPQFGDDFIVSERSPARADVSPSERIYNLPELMDRLIHEDKLPEEKISAYQTSDTAILIVVKAPTVIAASFSQGRTVQILNRSRLTLICPFCENVEIRQQKPLGDGDEPTSRVYSNTCIGYDYRSEGKLERSIFGKAYLGNVSTRERCDKLNPRKPRENPIEPSLAQIELEPWMPQALVSQLLRGEHPSQTAERWRAIYPISSVR